MRVNDTESTQSTKVYFSKEQYAHLNKVFPEMLGTPKSTDAELRHWAGIRQVVQYVRQNVRG
jgi:hypothetical protein